jgi:hypothetical protein
MTVRFGTDEFARLTCEMERGAVKATASAANREAAEAGMREALASVEVNGVGECFWQEAGGEYRWVFRREGENVRVAVLWSAGVLTGWEHVFWAECPMAGTVGQIRNALDAVR